LRPPGLGTTALWRRNLRLAVLVLTAIAAGPPLGAEPPREPEPAYTRTVTEAEVLDLISGRQLDTADPAYCEKTRDVCLASLCGAMSREKTRAACWEQCTQRLFERCQQEKAKRVAQ
jgi:hypothetical protein